MISEHAFQPLLLNKLFEHGKKVLTMILFGFGLQTYLDFFLITHLVERIGFKYKLIKIVKKFIVFCIERCMAFMITAFSHKTIYFYGDRVDLMPADNPSVITCNHQSSADIFFIAALGPHINAPSSLRFIMKQDILYFTPWFGPSLMLAHGCIPLTRRNRSSDLQRIRSGVRKLINDKMHFNIVIFPEGTRFHRSKCRPNEWGLKNLLVPKFGGLQAIIKEITHEPHYVLDLTMYYDHECSLSLYDLICSDCTIIIKTTEDYYTQLNDDMFQNSLMKKYTEKDIYLENVKSNTKEIKNNSYKKFQLDYEVPCLVVLISLIIHYLFIFYFPIKYYILQKFMTLTLGYTLVYIDLLSVSK